MNTDEIMSLTRDDWSLAVLVNSNVLLDVMTENARRHSWSTEAIEQVADLERLVINPVIYAEV
jgi:predicted nucleic acid-binding protein